MSCWRSKDQRDFCDDVCGNFKLPCNANLIEIFNIIDKDKKANGSVTIFYDYGCSDYLQIFIEDSEGCQRIFSLFQGSSRTLVVDDFVKIQLSCPNGLNTKPCSGKYCLNYEIVAERRGYRRGGSLI